MRKNTSKNVLSTVSLSLTHFDVVLHAYAQEREKTLYSHSSVEGIYPYIQTHTHMEQQQQQQIDLFQASLASRETTTTILGLELRITR